jgi:hypothetical protein
MSFAGTPSRSPGGRPRGTSALGDAVRGVSSFAARLSGGAARRGAADLEAARDARATGARPAPARRSTRELEPSVSSDLDWGRVGAFGAGIAIGALIGASTALLYAPQSGRATRAVIRKRARYFTSSAGDAWDELGRELRGAARRSRRGVSRSVTRGRWKAADLLDA